MIQHLLAIKKVLEGNLKFRCLWGEGPFPTEYGGTRSQAHCRSARREDEARDYPDVSVNDPDEFRRGIALRMRGNEYGATTERPRRVGRLDLPLLRYSTSELSGPNVVLTKLDVLSETASIEICTHYIYRGPDYRYGDREFRAGDRIIVAVPDAEILARCEPVYAVLSGWLEPISHMRDKDELPQKLQRLLRFIEEEAGAHIVLLSVGSDRDETIFMKPPIRV